jgi:hypothetical protein
VEKKFHGDSEIKKLHLTVLITRFFNGVFVIERIKYETITLSLLSPLRLRRCLLTMLWAELTGWCTNATFDITTNIIPRTDIGTTMDDWIDTVANSITCFTNITIQIITALDGRRCGAPFRVITKRCRMVRMFMVLL